MDDVHHTETSIPRSELVASLTSLIHSRMIEHPLPDQLGRELTFIYHVAVKRRYNFIVAAVEQMMKDDDIPIPQGMLQAQEEAQEDIAAHSPTVSAADTNTAADDADVGADMIMTQDFDDETQSQHMIPPTAHTHAPPEPSPSPPSQPMTSVVSASTYAASDDSLVSPPTHTDAQPEMDSSIDDSVPPPLSPQLSTQLSGVKRGRSQRARTPKRTVSKSATRDSSQRVTRSSSRGDTGHDAVRSVKLEVLTQAENVADPETDEDELNEDRPLIEHVTDAAEGEGKQDGGEGDNGYDEAKEAAGGTPQNGGDDDYEAECNKRRRYQQEQSKRRRQRAVTSNLSAALNDDAADDDHEQDIGGEKVSADDPEFADAQFEDEDALEHTIIHTAAMRAEPVRVTVPVPAHAIVKRSRGRPKGSAGLPKTGYSRRLMGNRARQFQCTYPYMSDAAPDDLQTNACAMLFGTEQQCEEHVCSVHTKTPRYVCPVCYKEMSDHSNFRRHKQLKHPELFTNPLIQRHSR